MKAKIINGHWFECSAAHGGMCITPGLCNEFADREGPLQEMVFEQWRNTKDWFPKLAGDLRHMALGLAGEAGEVANLIKKWDRGDFGLDDITDGDNASVTKRDLIAEEVADVLIYALNIWGALGVDPDEVLRKKNEYNEYRFGGKK